jgi:DNA-binding CsgD family transcriptional regulator
VEISQELFISPHTARHHTERVLTKLGVHARTDVRTALVRN